MKRRPVLFSMILVLGGCADSSEFRPLLPGDPAPEYAAVSLAGDTVALEDLEGTVVLLNVWATWCIPCREEMPALERLQQERGAEGLRVVGSNIDAHSEDQVRGFVADLGITFTVLLDPRGTVSRTFRTTGVPESILIGRDGRIARRWYGAFDPFAPESVRAIDEALGEDVATTSSS